MFFLTLLNSHGGVEFLSCHNSLLLLHALRARAGPGLRLTLRFGLKSMNPSWVELGGREEVLYLLAYGSGKKFLAHDSHPGTDPAGISENGDISCGKAIIRFLEKAYARVGEGFMKPHRTSIISQI